MTTQAEAMRQVTAERDMLRVRLLPQSQPLARSVTEGVDSGSWIAAAYGTDSRPARPSSGGEPLLDLQASPGPLRHRDIKLCSDSTLSQTWCGLLMLGQMRIAPKHTSMIGWVFSAADHENFFCWYSVSLCECRYPTQKDQESLQCQLQHLRKQLTAS